MDKPNAWGAEALDWAKKTAKGILPWAAALGLGACQGEVKTRPDTRVRDEIVSQINDAMSEIVIAGAHGVPVYVIGDKKQRTYSKYGSEAFRCELDNKSFDKYCLINDIIGGTYREIGDSTVTLGEHPRGVLELNSAKTSLKLTARGGDIFEAKIGSADCKLTHRNESEDKNFGSANVSNKVYRGLMEEFNRSVEDFTRYQNRAKKFKIHQLAQLDF